MIEEGIRKYGTKTMRELNDEEYYELQKMYRERWKAKHNGDRWRCEYCKKDYQVLKKWQHENTKIHKLKVLEHNARCGAE